MQKFEIIALVTVQVQRKMRYSINAENEKEYLDCIGKGDIHLDINEAEILNEHDIDNAKITDILKGKVIVEEIEP